MIKNLEKRVAALLLKKNMSVSVAESMTGGLLSQKLTSISGSSKYFMGGVIVYSNYAKEKILNVPFSLIEKYGAISKESAESLAGNIAELFKTDIGLSVIGNAGPTVQEKKPIGLVYIGICLKNSMSVFEINLSGDRREIRAKSCDEILKLLLEKLEGGI